MNKRKTWIKSVVAIVVIWGFATLGVVLARDQAPTAEKIIAFIEGNPIDGLSPDARGDIIDELAGKVNRLPIEERQKMRLGDAAGDFYRSMTPEERARYLDQTLSRGMQQMMTAFNEMPREQRQEIVDRALNDINEFRSEMNGEMQRDPVEQENAERFINEGLKAYLTDANAETKLDLQPLVEQIQSVMQESRRR